MYPKVPNWRENRVSRRREDHKWRVWGTSQGSRRKKSSRRSPSRRRVIPVSREGLWSSNYQQLSKFKSKSTIIKVIVTKKCKNWRANSKTAPIKQIQLKRWISNLKLIKLPDKTKSKQISSKTQSCYSKVACNTHPAGTTQRGSMSARSVAKLSRSALLLAVTFQRPILARVTNTTTRSPSGTGAYLSASSTKSPWESTNSSVTARSQARPPSTLALRQYWSLS